MDLRERVLAACDAKEGTRRQIAERFKVSEDWVYKLLRQRRELGTIAPQYHRRGRKAVFQGESLERLKALVDEQPDRALGVLPGSAHTRFFDGGRFGLGSAAIIRKRRPWSCRRVRAFPGSSRASTAEGARVARPRA